MASFSFSAFNESPYWNFLLANVFNAGFIALVIVIALILIHRYTNNDLFRINYRLLKISTALICLAYSAGVIIGTESNQALPTTLEPATTSMLQFFPRLTEMPLTLHLLMVILVSICLLCLSVNTGFTFHDGQVDARKDRDKAQKERDEAKRAANKALQKAKALQATIDDLKTKNDGLYAGYLFIIGNSEVSKKVKDEFSRRIQEAKKARTAACQQKNKSKKRTKKRR